MRSTQLCAAFVALTTVMSSGCADPVTDPVSTAAARMNAGGKPGQPGSAKDRMLYQVRLDNAATTKSHGVVLIEVVGGFITVTAHATDLAPTTNPASPVHIPQHIHLNPSCSNGGGILLNLDDRLTVPGEAPGTGTAYPTANRAGVMNYYARRSLSELRAAVNTHRGLTLANDQELLAWLNLEERNAHMHVPTAPFPAVNCGEVTRLN